MPPVYNLSLTSAVIDRLLNDVGFPIYLLNLVLHFTLKVFTCFFTKKTR
jgi:hypothetical protein